MGHRVVPAPARPRQPRMDRHRAGVHLLQTLNQTRLTSHPLHVQRPTGTEQRQARSTLLYIVESGPMWYAAQYCTVVCAVPYEAHK